MAAVLAISRALERFAPHLDPVASPVDLSSLSTGMHWRMLGPTRCGRTAAATGVPGRPNEFYFGAVKGGVWKTIDAGRVWEPVFDSQPVASVGAIAVAREGAAPAGVYVTHRYLKAR